MTPEPIKAKIVALKAQYDQLKAGKEALLRLLDEAEIPEAVYNSNAIENSTLTLHETEQILLEMEAPHDLSLREVFEAKNLARVMEYLRGKETVPLTKDFILTVHQMLLGNIDEKIAGRLRRQGEFVRIGSFIAVPPEHIENRLDSLLNNFTSSLNSFFLDRVALFHLEFELIHPFVDGNGIIGRAILNYQLQAVGLPPVTIRTKDKKKYRLTFIVYQDSKDTRKMETMTNLAIMESLHKRITYLLGQNIIPLTDHARNNSQPIPAALNKAARQTIPAFREKGVWKIGV